MIGLPSSFLTTPIAHRGLHDVADGRAENSPTAITAAINYGYGIEIDVQLSKDGVAIVFHDYHLDRLTAQSGTLAEQNERELSHITLAGCHDTIPTLSQMLNLISGQVPLLIEIKDQSGNMGPNVGELEAAVADALQSYTGHIAVMSFNPHSVAVFAKLRPKTPVGLVTDNFSAGNWPTLSVSMQEHLDEISDFDRTGSCFISHNQAYLHNPAVIRLKTRGVPILCWTIKSPDAEITARKIANNITFEGYEA